MRVKARYNPEAVVVYREIIGVMVFTSLIAIAFAGTGYFFTTIKEAFATWWMMFGLLFLVIGIALIIYLPFYFRKIWIKGGAVLLKATRHGISVSPQLNVTPVKHQWDEIDKVVITRRFVHKHSEGTSFARPQMIVFLKSHVMENIGLIERSIKWLAQSPEGSNVYYIDVPYNELMRLPGELARLAPAVLAIESYTGVFFNSLESTESYQP